MNLSRNVRCALIVPISHAINTQIMDTHMASSRFNDNSIFLACVFFFSSSLYFLKLDKKKINSRTHEISPFKMFEFNSRFLYVEHS